MKKRIELADESNRINLEGNIQEQTFNEEEIQRENNVETRKSSNSMDISFSTIVSVLFIIALISLVAIKFIFPTIDSVEANFQNRKVGKSIVANYFSLIQNSKYGEAMKLIDSGGQNLTKSSLLSDLEKQFGTTDIVGYNILDVTENSSTQSVVNTAVSYMQNGKLITKNQSVTVKNTTDGWKITLTGLVKKFKLKSDLITINNKISITPQAIEYCEEGINVTLKLKNNTYNSQNVRGNFQLKTSKGLYTENVDTIIKPLVQYNHNLLFHSSSGEPVKIIINLNGYEKKEMPIAIIK